MKNAPEDQNKPADNDYWSKDEENECVIRIHRTPRKKLFDPRGSNCPIDVEFLDETLTIIKYLNGENDSIQSTTWRNLINRKIGLAKPIFRSTSTLLRNGAKPQGKTQPFLTMTMNPCLQKKSRKLCVTVTTTPSLTLLKKNLAVPGEEHDHYKAPRNRSSLCTRI